MSKKIYTLGCCGKDFENKHPSCSFVTCCVKKKGLEVCGECGDFSCPKFEQQNRRINLLKTMLEGYDDGRCKSFYCLSAALLSIKSLDEALVKADKKIEDKSVGKEDLRGKAKVLKEILNQFAAEEREELRLR